MLIKNVKMHIITQPELSFYKDSMKITIHLFGIADCKSLVCLASRFPHGPRGYFLSYSNIFLLVLELLLELFKYSFISSWVTTWVIQIWLQNCVEMKRSTLTTVLLKAHSSSFRALLCDSYYAEWLDRTIWSHCMPAMTVTSKDVACYFFRLQIRSKAESHLSCP